MTNSWTNLNLFLSLDEQFQNSKKELTKLLINACIQGNKDEIKKSIQKGAYINSFDQIQTPIMATVDFSSIDIAKYLLKIGANPCTLINDKDATWLALEQKKYDFLELFINKKFKFNYKKDTGETLLIYATKNSDLEAVKLIAYKVNVNEKDFTGSTALHHNFLKTDPSSDDFEIAKILLQCGADTNTQNNDGISCESLKSGNNSILLEQNQLNQVIQVEEDIIPIFDSDEPTPPKKIFKI